MRQTFSQELYRLSLPGSFHQGKNIMKKLYVYVKVESGNTKNASTIVSGQPLNTRNFSTRVLTPQSILSSSSSKFSRVACLSLEYSSISLRSSPVVVNFSANSVVWHSLLNPPWTIYNFVEVLANYSSCLVHSEILTTSYFNFFSFYVFFCSNAENIGIIWRK